jgi:hypothetical protein
LARKLVGLCAVWFTPTGTVRHARRIGSRGFRCTVGDLQERRRQSVLIQTAF